MDHRRQLHPAWASETEVLEADVFFEDLLGSVARFESVDPNTAEARRRFPAMQQSFAARLTQIEQRAMQGFAQSWALPATCPFVTNGRLTREEKAVLAGAMLAAAGVKGDHCGDWVMRVYQYAQGDPYISSRQWTRMQVRGLRHPERRWKSLAWAPAGRAVAPNKLSLIEPGRWVMYQTGRGSRRAGHSILVVKVIRRDTSTGRVRLEALESGWFSHVNIAPRYRTILLNCGSLQNGVRAQQIGSIFSIQTPERRTAYTTWLQQRHSATSP